jgi:hypothetical protein
MIRPLLNVVLTRNLAGKRVGSKDSEPLVVAHGLSLKNIAWG